jgi:hypothetical protein
MGSGGSKGLVQDDGFGMFCGVFDHSDIEACGAWLQAETIVQSRAGARHLMQYAAVRQFAGDPRLLSIARRFLGADPIPFRATLFDKSARRNWLVAWHQDTALPLRRRVDVTGWGPWSMKGGVTYAHAPAAALSHVVALRVHIDDSGSDNGPLRVLPGTHLRGVLSDAQLEGAVRHIPPVECIAPAGGVVAMRPLVVHASSKADSDCPRRVLHVEYADDVFMGGGLELALA